jgi:hypothetical protein
VKIALADHTVMACKRRVRTGCISAMQ